MVSAKIRRLLFSEYTKDALSKVPKVITEQPHVSFSAKHTNKHCRLCTTLSKKVVQSRKKAKTQGKKAGEKQEKAEEIACMLPYRELVTDNSKSFKCVSTESCRDIIELICHNRKEINH